MMANRIQEIQFTPIFLFPTGCLRDNPLNFLELDIGVDFAVYIADTIVIGDASYELIGEGVVFGANNSVHIWVCIRGEFNNLVLIPTRVAEDREECIHSNTIAIIRFLGEEVFAENIVSDSSGSRPLFLRPCCLFLLVLNGFLGGVNDVNMVFSESNPCEATA